MELEFDLQFLQLKKIAIYGTGDNARNFLNEYGQYLDIVGIIDPVKTGDYFNNRRIVSIEEIAETVEIIIVCASANVELIIYDRIHALCSEMGIELYGIHGGNLYEFYGTGFNRTLSEQELLNQIDIHDVISFDLFDTLLGRRTLYPADVYAIVQSRIEKQGIKLDNFYFNRIQTEINLLPTEKFLIDEIYNYLQNIYNFNDDIKEIIKETEFQVEREVSVSCKAIRDIFTYALLKGKRIFILTDMYLPKIFLKELLDNQGIRGYEDIVISGELHMNKHNGMYLYFKEVSRNTNIIHIGDNYMSDGFFARKAGIDVCLVSSVRDMLMKSEYQSLMKYSGGNYENLTIGLFARTAFDKLPLQSVVKPETMTEYAVLFLAPLITGFVIWIALEAKRKSYQKILFAARDGFLLMELYEILRRLHPEYELPEGVYLYTSRKAVWYIYEDKFDKKERNDNYIQYLSDLKLGKSQKYAFVDLISHGTTQAALEKIFFDKLEGLYLVQYISNYGKQNDIYIQSLYKETPITEMYFTESSNLILEMFLTSTEPSLKEVGENGKLIFQNEYRTDTQMKMIQTVQKTIRTYFEMYCNLSDMKSFNKELIKEIWTLRKFANSELIRETVKNMVIEDSLNRNMLFFEFQL